MRQSRAGARASRRPRDARGDELPTKLRVAGDRRKRLREAEQALDAGRERTPSRCRATARWDVLDGFLNTGHVGGERVLL